MPKHSLYLSFTYAFKGLRLAFRERNFLLHCLSASLVIFLGLWLQVTATEWCILLLCTGLVMTAEIMNTAIEKLVDLVSPGFNIDAGRIKDLSAAAVLWISIVSAIIGLVIFIPYLL
mgnify:FL=1